MSDRDAGGAAPLRAMRVPAGRRAIASPRHLPGCRGRTGSDSRTYLADDTRAAFRPCIDPANLPFANTRAKDSRTKSPTCSRSNSACR